MWALKSFCPYKAFKAGGQKVIMTQAVISNWPWMLRRSDALAQLLKEAYGSLCRVSRFESNKWEIEGNTKRSYLKAILFVAIVAWKQNTENWKRNPIIL